MSSSFILVMLSIITIIAIPGEAATLGLQKDALGGGSKILMMNRKGKIISYSDDWPSFGGYRRMKRSDDGRRGSVMFLTKPGEVDFSADMETKAIETSNKRLKRSTNGIDQHTFRKWIEVDFEKPIGINPHKVERTTLPTGLFDDNPEIWYPRKNKPTKIKSGEVDVSADTESMPDETLDESEQRHAPYIIIGGDKNSDSDQFKTSKKAQIDKHIFFRGRPSIHQVLHHWKTNAKPKYDPFDGIF